MGRQVSKMTYGGRRALTAESRKALEHSAAPGNMRMAARAMLEAIGGSKSDAHRKTAGRGS